MDRNKFIQSSATTRVFEKQLLDKVQLDRLVEADSVEEALRYLQDSVYQQFITKLQRPEDYELALSGEQKRTFDEMYKISPMNEVVDLVAMKYEYHNLKVLLKEMIRGLDYSRMYVPIGSLDISHLKEAFKSGKRSEIDAEYYDVVNAIYNEFLEYKDPQNIDILVDKDYFIEMKRVADQSGVELFIRYVEDLIDFTNIKALLRCQKQGKDIAFLDRVIIEGGMIPKKRYRDFLFQKLDGDSALFKSSRVYRYVKEGINQYEVTSSLSGFEKLMDDYLVDVIREAKKVTYGPEVIFAFLMAKENEIKNLRIIMVSKLNGLPSTFIRERLRDSYV